ncbi:hypothetical protein C1645_820801 [Glomus cerebriforme]|uniref:Uncharacterized protein n=1 Tax=Glomus cerebriforme TaxID=658196 RepID=A0A397T7R1_9GLOM|nr:hypothetical protein C1645_820801 [Glomus cerebriforme]
MTKCYDYFTLKNTNSNQNSAFIFLKAKILDQYPNLYREFSNENFDYYGITDEISYSLCKLDHNDEESIEGNQSMAPDSYFEGSRKLKFKKSKDFLFKNSGLQVLLDEVDSQDFEGPEIK